MTANNTFLFRPYHLFGQVDCSTIIMLSAQLRRLNFSCNKTSEYIHLRIQIRLSQNSLAYYSFSQFKGKKKKEKAQDTSKTLHCQIHMWQECAAAVSEPWDLCIFVFILMLSYCCIASHVGFMCGRCFFQ